MTSVNQIDINAVNKRTQGCSCERCIAYHKRLGISTKTRYKRIFKIYYRKGWLEDAHRGIVTGWTSTGERMWVSLLFITVALREEESVS